MSLLAVLAGLSLLVQARPLQSNDEVRLFVAPSDVSFDHACAVRIVDSLPPNGLKSVYRLLDGQDCTHLAASASLFPLDDLYWLYPSTLEQQPATAGRDSQVVFARPWQSADHEQLVHLTDDQLSAMTRSPEYKRIEFYRLASTSSSRSTTDKVEQRAIDRLAREIDSLEFDPLVDKVLSGLSRKQIERDVRTLSGEDQSALAQNERWHTRHSMSDGVVKAQRWIKRELEAGNAIACEDFVYRNGFVPAIACTLPPVVAGGGGARLANETIVIGAHFDSRGTFGNMSAPGADDDGSGTALILSLAREIRKHSLSFERKVIIAAFSGEEQGLVGSAEFAKMLKARGEDVVMMLQVDMIGYRKPGEPFQMAFPDLIGLLEARDFVARLSAMYAPELVVGQTPACCSDHQSFVQVGYPATWVFERNGPIADPCYHDSCDLSRREGYDFEQIHLITKVVLATVLQLGRFSFT